MVMCDIPYAMLRTMVTDVCEGSVDQRQHIRGGVAAEDVVGATTRDIDRGCLGHYVAAGELPLPPEGEVSWPTHPSRHSRARSDLQVDIEAQIASAGAAGGG